MRSRSRAPWIHRCLVRLLPADFRAEFGRAIEREVVTSLLEAEGASRRLRVWRRTLVDLVLAIVTEHWDSRIGEGRRWDMGETVQDARRAVRGFRRSASFSVVAVLTLGLGIGATTVIFSVVQGVLIAPLPYPDPERIVSINEALEGTPTPLAISYVNALDWKAAQTSLEALALSRGGAMSLQTPDGAEQLSALFADAEYFDVLGARASLGRLFGPDDNRVPGGHPVVVLSHAAWERIFASDRGIVGRSLNLSGTPFTVVGVLSADFRDPFAGVNGGPNELIVPAMMVGQVDPQGNAVLRERRLRTFGGIGKLRPGVSVKEAEADLRRIAARLQEVAPINKGMTAVVEPFRRAATNGLRGPTLALLGGALVLLVIACFNVANLLLVRGAARRREFAVQSALGADRRRLFRLLAVESLLLALVGGALGTIVARLALPFLLSLVPTQLPATADVAVNLPVIGLAIAVSLAAGLAAGLLPAVRQGGFDVRETLAGSRRLVGDARGDRIRSGLVLLQIATATVLLASSVLLIRAFRDVRSADPGFVTEGVLTMRLSLPTVVYGNDASMAAAAEQVAARVSDLAEVEWAQPWGPGRPGFDLSFQTSVPDEMVTDDFNDAPIARQHSVGPEALGEMGLTLLRGRTLSETDDAESPYVAVISESMAQELWPGEDPIGRQYHDFQPTGGTSPANRHWTVIGVVSDAQHGGRLPSPGGIRTSSDSYFPFAQRPERTFTLLVKTTGPADLQPIRTAILGFDPEIPIFQVATMKELFAEEEGTSRFAAELMAVFGLAALVLAGLGVYGVISFTVTQRVREIGLRAALGARTSRTLRRFVSHGVRLAASGVVLGGAAAYSAAHGLRAVVPSAPEMDASALAIAGIALFLVAVLSGLLPAFRATRVAPAEALRGE